MRADGCKSKAEAHSELQRERILCAARHCFIESGFHAASMALIAEMAGMSVGLIYRYFENKNAIILAIIDHHLAEIQTDLRLLQSVPDVLARRIVERFRSWQQRECMTLDPGLLLEIVALANRDQQVAEALRVADQRIRAEIGAWLEQAWISAGHHLTETDILERVMSLQCFVEGLAVRVIKQPDCDLDRVENSLRPLLRYLLPA